MEPELESHRDALDRWQAALGLSDWRIRTQAAPGDWKKSGDIKIDANNRLALLLVNETVAPEHLDEVVLHELVHLKLHALDRMLEDLLTCVYGDNVEDPRRSFAHGQFMDHLETATQGITQALLTLGGREERMVTPSLEQAADEELGER